MIETQTRQRALEGYIARVLPPELRPGAPVPATWRGDPAEWEDVRAAAEAALRQKGAFDFAYGLAIQGFTIDELVEGQQVEMGADGKVRRPPRSSLSAELSRRCSKVLAEIRDLQAPLEMIIVSDLERGSRGAGVQRDLERKVAAAEAAVAARRAELAAKHQEQVARPVIDVHIPFRSIGGRSWSPGRHKVTPEELAQLQEWVRRMEAQRDQHGQDAPAGFTAGQPWPPFELVPPAS